MLPNQIQTPEDPSRLMSSPRSIPSRLRSASDRTLGWVLVILMAAAVLNVLWQVFTRYFLDNPSSYTDELARYLLAWIAMLGASYGVGSRSHLAIDLLPRKLKGRKRMLLEVFINISILLFAILVLVVGGWKLVAATLTNNQLSPAFGIRVGYVYIALPLAGLIMAGYAILNALECIAARSTSAEAES